MNNKIRIIWRDAVLYSVSVPLGNRWPVEKITEGELVRKDEEGFVVRNPYTVNKRTGKRTTKEEKENYLFLFIPHGMILEVTKNPA